MKIVLVEDNDAHAMLVERCIECVNPRVDVLRLRDGEGALDFLASCPSDDDVVDSKPALMLLDLRLPRVSGLEVLRELHSTGLPRSMPIVVLSSSDSTNDVEQANEFNIDGYLVKPYEFGELQQSIRALMERFELV